MSRKLATTIKDSTIPGKYKRVLEAYAAFANNDGTNIYPAKEKLGKKAGASSDTIYRNTPDLLASGILSIAESHTCRIEACGKGKYHYTGRQGKYTTVYNLDISFLQNAETYLSAKCSKVNAAKCRKVLAAKCGTTQALKETPAPLGNIDSSALTGGIDLLTDRQTESLAIQNQENQNQTPSGLGAEEEKKNQPQEKIHPTTADEFRNWHEFIPAMSVMQEFYPSALTDKLVAEQYGSCVFLAHLPWGLDGTLAMLRWNHAHEGGKWRFRSPKQMSNAFCTENQAFKNNYDTHDFIGCPKCRAAGLKHYETLREIAEYREANAKDAAIVFQQRNRSKTGGITAVEPCSTCGERHYGFCPVEIALESGGTKAAEAEKWLEAKAAAVGKEGYTLGELSGRGFDVEEPE